MEIVAAQIYSKAVYGNFRQVWLIYYLFSSFFVLGLPKAILYFFPLEKNKDRPSLISQIFSALSVSAIVFATVIFFISPVIGKSFSNPSIIPLLRVFSVYIALNLPTEIMIPLYLADHKLVKAGKTQIIFALFYLLPLIIFIFFKFSLIYIFSALAVVTLFKLAWTWQTIRAEYGLKINLDINDKLRLILKYSIPISLSAIVGVSYDYLDKFLISIFYTNTFFAVFAIGTLKIPLIDIITYQLANSLVPTLSKLYKHNKNKLFLELWHAPIRRVTLIIYSAMFYFFFFADPIIPLIFSEKYIASIPIFKSYLLIMFLRITAYSPVIQALGETKHIFRGSIIGIFMNLVISLVLIGKIGYWGPVIGTIVANFFVILYYLFIIQGKLKIKFKEILPFKLLLMIALDVAIIGFVTKLFVNYLNMGIVFEVVFGFIIFSIAVTVDALWRKYITLNEILAIVGYEKKR